MVRLLLANGADVNAQGGDNGNALTAAAWMSDDDDAYEVIKLLLEYGADVNAPGGKGFPNPLQEASRSGNEKVVQLLLEKGADANAHDDGFPTSSLELGLKSKNKKVVQSLFDHGADVNTLPDTAFKWAASLFCFEKGPRCCMEMRLISALKGKFRR